MAKTVKITKEQLERLVEATVKSQKETITETEKVEEGLFGSNKREKLEKAFNQKMKAWGRQGYSLPDGMTLDQLLDTAEADNYEGAPGVNKSMEIVYRPSGKIKYKSHGRKGPDSF